MFGVALSFAPDSGDRDCWCHFFLTPARNQGRRHRYRYTSSYCVYYFALTFDRMHHVLGNVMPSDRTAKWGSALDEYFRAAGHRRRNAHGRGGALVARSVPPATRMGPLSGPRSAPMRDRPRSDLGSVSQKWSRERPRERPWERPWV